jgi:hypothetical protein
VPASNRDGSIRLTVAQMGSPATFFVRSVQVRPPSRVFQTLPSLVPAQIRPRWISDGAIAKTTSP